MRPPRRLATTGAGLLLALASCEAPPAPTPSAPHRPVWIQRPAAGRPADLYLTSVGAGPSRAAAEQRALERLAQEINADVRSVERLSERYEQGLPHHVAADHRRTLQLIRGVEIRTARELLGADIVEVWRDPETGERFALAALDRRVAAGVYADAIDHERRLIRDALRVAADAPSAFAALRELETALESVERRDDLLAAYRVVAPPGLADALDPGDAVASRAEIERRLDALRAAIRVDVLAAPEAPFELRVAAEQGLINAGVPPAPRGEADLRLAIDYDAGWSTSYDRGRRVASWRLRARMIHAPSGRTLEALALSGRAAGVGLEDPRREALHAAHAAFVEALPGFLDRSLGS